MPDILANGEFGRDDGIKCVCGAKTFLTLDQGDGLLSYDCENQDCDEITMVQFEADSDDECFDEEYYEPPFDIDEFEFEI
jgi:hypothetical protein